MQNTAEQTVNPNALPPTAKQMAYARKIAGARNLVLPWDVQQDRRALSRWIDQSKQLAAVRDDRPSSKQVAYAEKIARIKRRNIPDECFLNRQLMSRWIDSNGFARR